jgi:acyl-CoA thioester hydrolase
VRIGTTSFTLTARFRRWPDGSQLVTSETVYVAVEPHTATKHPLTDDQRHRLTAGAPGILLDHAGALAARPG